jgi:N-acetylmuramoyl-L-alanine amidase
VAVARFVLFFLTAVLALVQALLLGLLVNVTTAKPAVSHELAGTPELLDMARTIWAESANQPVAGQLAVGFTVINRIAIDPARYGRTVSEVVRRRHQYTVWTGKRRQARLMALTDADIGFIQAKAAAALVLRRAVADPSLGSTHFTDFRIQRPAWTRGAVPLRIASHVFYRNVR